MTSPLFQVTAITRTEDLVELVMFIFWTLECNYIVLYILKVQIKKSCASMMLMTGRCKSFTSEGWIMPCSVCEKHSDLEQKHC